MISVKIKIHFANFQKVVNSYNQLNLLSRIPALSTPVQGWHKHCVRRKLVIIEELEILKHE